MQKIILTLDSQGLTAYQRCPCLYNYSIKENRGTPRLSEALVKGSSIHSILEFYYASRISKRPISDTLLELINLKFAEFTKELPSEDIQVIIPRMTQYITHYQDETWVPLKTEIGFSKILYEDENHQFIYEGKIDLLVNVQQVNAFVDHKSQSWHLNLPPDSNQFLGYAWATGFSLGIINYINLAPSKAPRYAFRREICNYPTNLVSEWRDSAIETYLLLTDSLKKSRFQKQRSGCLGPYGLCDFHQVCHQTNSNVIDGMLERDFIIKAPWSPWSLPVYE
jgi:hypothetical protein